MFISNLKNQVLDISDDPIWIPHVGLRPHGLKKKTDCSAELPTILWPMVCLSRISQYGNTVIWLIAQVRLISSFY